MNRILLSVIVASLLLASCGTRTVTGQSTHDAATTTYVTIANVSGTTAPPSPPMTYSSATTEPEGKLPVIEIGENGVPTDLAPGRYRVRYAAQAGWPDECLGVLEVGAFDPKETPPTSVLEAAPAPMLDLETKADNSPGSDVCAVYMLDDPAVTTEVKDPSTSLTPGYIPTTTLP